MYGKPIFHNYRLIIIINDAALSDIRMIIIINIALFKDAFTR